MTASSAWRSEIDRKSTRLNYTLSLHDALPICHAHFESLAGGRHSLVLALMRAAQPELDDDRVVGMAQRDRSEEHTSELHSFLTRRSSDLSCALRKPGRWPAFPCTRPDDCRAARTRR